MKFITSFFLIFTILILTSFTPEKPAYQFFNAKGKKADYSDLLKDALKADVVFFGELHNNPICHWLQLELTRDLYARNDKKLILGAEMFEADDQLILNEFLSKTIRTKNFEDEAKLWNNYKTDYRPLAEFARDSGVPFIATNIPRRYASMVHMGGFEALDKLPADAKKYIAPLPVEYDFNLPGYKAMLDMKDEGAGKAGMNQNLPKAQAIKDATMAWFISQNLEKGKIFLHFNGAYHSNDYEGIIWYLRKLNPDLKILTISSEEQKDPDDLKEDYENQADYILITPESMTKTY